MDVIEKIKTMLTAAKPKMPKPKYKQIGVTVVPHFYHPRIRDVRKIIRKYDDNIERAIAENPDLANVRVKEVPVRQMQLIDNSKKYRRS